MTQLATKLWAVYVDLAKVTAIFESIGSMHARVRMHAFMCVCVYVGVCVYVLARVSRGTSLTTILAT